MRFTLRLLLLALDAANGTYHEACHSNTMDHDKVKIGTQWRNCTDARLFCCHSTIGASVRDACPETCGVCDSCTDKCTSGFTYTFGSQAGQPAPCAAAAGLCGDPRYMVQLTKNCPRTCDACPTCNDGVQNGFEARIDCGGECTKACPTCSSTSGLKCNEGNVKDSALAAFKCAGGDESKCLESECCAPRSNCSAFQCRGNQVRNDAALCSGKACAAGDAVACCEDKQQCGKASALDCHSGRVKDPSVSSKYCAGTACQEAECCVPRASCANFTSCGARQIVNNDALCAGPSCGAGDAGVCCTDLPTCGGSTELECPSNMVKIELYDKVQANKYCKALQCSTAECCVTQPLCDDGALHASARRTFAAHLLCFPSFVWVSTPVVRCAT